MVTIIIIIIHSFIHSIVIIIVSIVITVAMVQYMDIGEPCLIWLKHETVTS